jgi:hypothetical protein
MGESVKTKLNEFLGDIVEDDLRKLVAAVEFDRLSGTRGLPHNTVLDALRPVLRQGGKYDRIPTPQRMFCTAFEDLLQTLPRSKKQFGRVSRTTIAPVWDWLCTEAMPEELLASEELVTQLILDQDWEKAWNVILEIQLKVGEFIKTVADDAIREPTAFKSLNKHISDRLVLADMRDISSCLLAAEQIRKIQVKFPGPVEQLSSKDVAWFDRQYQELLGEEDRLSAYLLLSLMGRMTKPWEILSVIEMMSDLSGEHACYVADWEFVCEVLLSDLDHVSTYFDGLKLEKVNWSELQENLTFFSKVGEAISNSGELSYNEAWAERIATNQSVLSQEFKRIVQGLPRELLKIFSDKSGLALSPGLISASFDEPLDPQSVEECLSIAEFTRNCAEQTKATPLKVEMDEVVSVLNRNIRHLKTTVMEKIQSSRGPERNCAIAYVDLLSQLTQILNPCFEQSRALVSESQKDPAQRNFGT